MEMNGLVKEIILYGLVPIISAVIGGVIGVKKQIKYEQKNVMPKLQVIVLKTAQALKTNKAIIQKYNNIIKIKIAKHPQIDGNVQKEKELKFQKITYKEVENEIGKHSIIFMGFQNEGKETIMLKKVFYDTDYDINAEVVPMINNNQSNYCFICSEADIPSALQGKTNGKNVKYDIKKMNDIIEPRILEKRGSLK